MLSPSVRPLSVHGPSSGRLRETDFPRYMLGALECFNRILRTSKISVGYLR